MNDNNEEKSLSLADLLQIVLKNIILICSITLGITILGGIYTFKVATPQYSSTSTIAVAIKNGTTTTSSTESVDYVNTLRVVQTIAEITTTDLVLEPVSNSTEISLKNLKKIITTTSSDTKYVITITTKAPSPELSKKITQETANSLINVCETNDTIKQYGATLGIVDPAKDGIYASPNKALYLIISFIGGLVVAFVVVLLKELISNKFKNKDDVERLTNRLIIGVQYLKGKNKVKHSTYKQISLVEANQENFESYNKLLNNIHYANIDNPLKIIMVTSSTVDELKSTTSANLAYCMANNAKKVLLIDLDTRRPVLHRTFKVERANGLVEYVDGKLSKEDIIKHTDSGVDIITIGEKILNPIVLLESNKLKELLVSLKENYDYIIIDTPPVLLCSDAMIISKYADGVVFNVALNSTKKKETLESIKILENVHANIIGLNVTNAIRSKHSNYYYYYSKHEN